MLLLPQTLLSVTNINMKLLRASLLCEYYRHFIGDWIINNVQSKPGTEVDVGTIEGISSNAMQYIRIIADTDDPGALVLFTTTGTEINKWYKIGPGLLTITKQMCISISSKTAATAEIFNKSDIEFMLLNLPFQVTKHFRLLEFLGRPQGPPRNTHLVHREEELGN